MHEEHFNVVFVGDKKFLESVGEAMSGLVVLLVTDFHFLLSTLKSSSGGTIDTSNGSV